MWRTSRSLALAALWVGWAGCTGPSAAGLARRYADALAGGRLSEAYALTSAKMRGSLSPEAFAERYADPALRQRRAEAIRAGAERVQVGPLIVAGQAGAWAVEETPPDRPEAVLRSFLDAAGRGDFELAWRLLASPWRARYTPARLREDFLAEPLVKERLARAKAALGNSWRPVDGGIELTLAQGRSVRLVVEEEGYRVEALE